MRRLCCLAALLFATCLRADSPESPATRCVVLNSETQAAAVGASARVHVDSTARAELSTIRALPASAFVAGRDHLNFGFTDAAIWFKFCVDNRSPRSDWLLFTEFPLIGRMAAYSSSDPNRPPGITGAELPYANRPAPGRRLALPLEIPPGAARDIYVRIASQETLQLDLEILTSAEYARRERDDRLLIGAYFGLLIAMLFYNLFLFGILRDASYFWYLLFLISNGLFIAAQLGVAFEYLWPESPRFALVSNPMLTGVAVASAMLFLRSFLQVSSYAPRLDRLMLALTGLGLAQACASLALPFQWSAMGAVGGAMLVEAVGVAALAYAIRRGRREAYVVVIAWTVYIVGAFLYILKTIGIVPNNWLTAWGLPIGSALEMVLISIALGFRFSKLRVEREESQLRLAFIERELKIGQELQESLLPHRKPDMPEIACEFHYEPYIAIGGDFYDFVERRSPRGLGLLVADAAGHGVGAALLAAMTKMAFANMRPFAEDGAILMTGVNRALISSGDARFITAAYLFLNFETRRASYVSAGHPPLIHCPGGGRPREVLRPAVALGWRDDFRYACDEFEIASGDRFVIYTDGITEARNASGEIFGEARLMMLIAQYAGRPARDLKAAILRATGEWTAARGIEDDITLLIADVRSLS